MELTSAVEAFQRESEGSVHWQTSYITDAI
jgi:hypothetical protein